MVLLEQVENLLQLICNICQIIGGGVGVGGGQIKTPQIYEHRHWNMDASQECDLLAYIKPRQATAMCTHNSRPRFPATGCSRALLRCRRAAYGASKHLSKLPFLLQNIGTVGRYCLYCTYYIVIIRIENSLQVVI